MAADSIRGVLAAAAERYGLGLDAAALDRLEQYIALIFRWQRIANLTAAKRPASFVREHVVDCLAVVPHLGDGSVLDVGSGAGLPGLVIAICEPERAVTLLEARAKRVRFLTQAVIELGLRRVAVSAGRAEDFRPPEPYDWIIARAFGSFSEFARVTRSAQGPGTQLVAMKAAIAPTELAEFDAATIEIKKLDVPGMRERHLLLLRSASASSPQEGDGLVP